MQRQEKAKKKGIMSLKRLEIEHKWRDTSHKFDWFDGNDFILA